jgi:rhodanese-related sulfurtransferase
VKLVVKKKGLRVEGFMSLIVEGFMSLRVEGFNGKDNFSYFANDIVLEMKFLSFFLLFYMGTLLQLEGQVPDSVKYKSLDPNDFHLQYLRTDSSILIDVREPFEFKGNRIKGAINIPASGNLDKAADTINKKLTLFLYCTSGFRSSNTAKKLYDKGFRKLYSLKGGIVAWRKEGMHIVKGKNKRKK